MLNKFWVVYHELLQKFIWIPQLEVGFLSPSWMKLQLAAGPMEFRQMNNDVNPSLVLCLVRKICGQELDLYFSVQGHVVNDYPYFVDFELYFAKWSWL